MSTAKERYRIKVLSHAAEATMNVPKDDTSTERGSLISIEVGRQLAQKQGCRIPSSQEGRNWILCGACGSLLQPGYRGTRSRRSSSKHRLKPVLPNMVDVTITCGTCSSISVESIRKKRQRSPSAPPKEKKSPVMAERTTSSVAAKRPSPRVKSRDQSRPKGRKKTKSGALKDFLSSLNDP